MALADNLLVYWQLDDVNSDYGSYNLTNNNSITFSSGLIGNCAVGGASNTNKNLSYNTGIAATDNNISFSLWAKMDTEIAANDAWFLRWENKATNYIGAGVLYEYNGGTRRLRFSLDMGGNFSNYNVALGTTNWHHIVATYNSSTSKINCYLDGTKIVTDASFGGLSGAWGSYRFTLMAYYSIEGTTCMKGEIDEVGLWNRVLSDSEVTTLYNSGAGNTYPFTEGSTRVHNLGTLGVGV